MGPNTESQFREPIAVERALLERLLEADFPGRTELAALLQNVLVRTIDKNGGLELESQVRGKAPVVKRVPVEAEGKRVCRGGEESQSTPDGHLTAFDRSKFHLSAN